MRRVHRPWPLLLIALAGVLGPPAVASGSDAGLKALVSEHRAKEKRAEARADALPGDRADPSSVAQGARRAARDFRRLARITDQTRRLQDEYRGRFAAEGPETTEALRGRTSMLTGLRDESIAYRRLGVILRRYATKLRRVRTSAGLERTLDQFARATLRVNATGQRGERRIKRGRTLIRNAPAPSGPLPAPAPAG